MLESPQARTAGAAGAPKKSAFPSGLDRVRLAQLLPLGGEEHYVFQAVVCSIVLSLALGQNAPLLCKVWCHDATPAHCPHESTAATRVSADQRCDDTAADVVAFVREDGRRAGSAPDAQHAAAAPPFRPAPAPASLPSGVEQGRRPLEERPLVFSLRI